MRRLLAGIVGLLITMSITVPSNADDSTIAQQLSAELRAAKSNRDLQSFRINVKVEDGVVWMKGSVVSTEQKSKALAIARAVPGVRLVVNDLTVGEQAEADVEPPASRDPLPAVVSKTKPIKLSSTANKTAVRHVEPTIQPVTALQTPMRPATSNSVIGPSAAIAGAGYQQAMQNQLMQQMQVVAAQQAMNAQMIQSQMWQREMAQANQMATAAEQLRMQNQMAQNRLVNYCANGGCGAGGGDMGGGGFAGSYGGYQGGYGGGNGGTFGGGGDMGNGQGVVYDQAQMPGYAWPSYASYPNYAALSYPKQYSAQAWPYIGPFYPYPQVPLGWRKVSLEWDDGWWMLDFTSK